jgi:hypothetical protein
VAWSEALLFRPAEPRTRSNAESWALLPADDEVIVPHAAAGADRLALLPFVRWKRSDTHAAYYCLTPATVAAARGQPAHVLQELLRRRAGGLPVWLQQQSSTQGHFQDDAVLLIEPSVLNQAARARSVRRYIRQKPAPGIVLVRHSDTERLRRALERQGIATSGAMTHRTVSAPPAELSPGDCAALLAALTFYREHAQPGASLTLSDELEQRLRTALPPALLARMEAPPQGAEPPQTVPPPTETGTQVIVVIRRSIRRRRPVEITYDTGGHGSWTRRTVRPIELEQRGNTLYLRAFCASRRAERVFRVDRIGTAALC